MCGRFTLTLEAPLVQQEFQLNDMPSGYQPRYNIAPSQPVAVVRDMEKRGVTTPVVAEWMRWGLIPSWAKDESIGNKMINARSETLTEKPSFRTAYQRRRCLILSDGFYEWQKQPGKSSQPHHFSRKDGKPFAFAGLWEFWKSPQGADVLSCTIITTRANGVVSPVHERMPVMLAAENAREWLKPAPTDQLQRFLIPFPAELMTSHPVSMMVNKPGVESPGLLEPVTLF
jgi:putative SOS response-associated peptidase YedK